MLESLKEIIIEPMTIQDYDEVMRLWLAISELGVSPQFDTRERIAAYLERNPGLSSVARLNGHVIGALLCGHDGRRGSVYHMGVAKEFRGQGIARRLVERSLNALKEQGIETGFLFVHAHNQQAAHFWEGTGWKFAPEIRYYYGRFD